MSKRIAPTLRHFVDDWMMFIDRSVGNPTPIRRKAVYAELRALLACYSALRKLRAAGGAWDVEARGMADRALERLDKVSGRKS
jgi:hypothetical protein